MRNPLSIVFVSLAVLFFFDTVSSQGHFEDDPDALPPHIEWVPIVQRNLSDVIREALQEPEYDSESAERYWINGRNRERTRADKFTVTGKMLNASYRQTRIDAQKGNEKLKALEERYKTASSNRKLLPIFSLSLLCVFQLLSRFCGSALFLFL